MITQCCALRVQLENWPSWQAHIALLTFSVPSETPGLVPPTAVALPLSTAPVDLDFVLVGGGRDGHGGRPGVCCGLFLILVFCKCGPS